MQLKVCYVIYNKNNNKIKFVISAKNGHTILQNVHQWRAQEKSYIDQIFHFLRKKDTNFTQFYTLLGIANVSK